MRIQVTDLFFRSLFAFFIIDSHTRQVIHVGVTRSPTDAWTAQQLREATPFGRSPNDLIRDRDGKFGSCFARVAATSGSKILKTPSHAKRPSAICERFLGSVRRECLDHHHLLILQEKQLHRVLRASVKSFNRARPQEAHRTTDSRTVWRLCPSRSKWWQDPLFASPGWMAPRVSQKCLIATGVRRSGGVYVVACASCGKSQTFSPFPVFFRCRRPAGICVFPDKNASRFEAMVSSWLCFSPQRSSKAGGV